MTQEKSKRAADRLKAHILIVEARYYADICDELCRGAIAAIERAGATWERVAVPGALEIPGAVAFAAAAKRFDGYVALGCVLRGATTHYDIVANESSRGLMELSLRGLCIGNGILTCENEKQAWERANVSELDKGGGAADAALTMIRFKRGIGKRAKR